MLNIETYVVRGQSQSVEQCLQLNPRYIVIGPGPGHPSQALLSKEIILACAGKIPILGVCLGHQMLAEIYGGKVEKAYLPMHGKTSAIFHSEKGLFKGIPQAFQATRYHSLIVNSDYLPACLEVTALTSEQEIMGLKHRNYAIESVQFHPESILTEHGLALLNNFISSSQ